MPLAVLGFQGDLNFLEAPGGQDGKGQAASTTEPAGALVGAMPPPTPAMEVDAAPGS